MRQIERPLHRLTFANNAQSLLGEESQRCDRTDRFPQSWMSKNGGIADEKNRNRIRKNIKKSAVQTRGRRSVITTGCVTVKIFMDVATSLLQHGPFR